MVGVGLIDCACKVNLDSASLTMTGQLNIFLSTVFFLQFFWKRVRRFVTPDLILLPALACLWAIMLWSMFSTFFSTLMPSPCLPTVINSAISVSKGLKDYLEVARSLWNYPETNTLQNLAFPKLGSASSTNFASV